MALTRTPDHNRPTRWGPDLTGLEGGGFKKTGANPYSLTLSDWEGSHRLRRRRRLVCHNSLESNAEAGRSIVWSYFRKRYKVNKIWRNLRRSSLFHGLNDTGSELTRKRINETPRKRAKNSTNYKVRPL